MGSQVNPTTHRIYFWLKEIARWDFRLTELHRHTLVLVKGDSQIEFQVNPTTT